MGPYAVGDFAFEDADGFLFGFASGLEALVVVVSFGAGVSYLGEGGDVDGSVETVPG